MRTVAVLLFLVLIAGCVGQRSVVAPDRSVDAFRTDSARQVVVTFRDVGSVLRSTPGSSARLYSRSSTYRASPYAQRLVAALSREYRLEWITGWRIDLLGVHCVVFRARTPELRDALIDRLRADDRLESVQAMNTFSTTSRTAQYNDPYFRLQRGVEAIRVPEAHRWSKGRRIPVAVIDTGVDVSHPELRGRVSVVRNYVDGDSRRFRADRHGTAVAGVIAAVTNNATGIIGVAPASDILSLKACWHESNDRPAVCSTVTLAEALAFAIERRVRIINLSLTGPADPLLARLLRRALERGIVVVAAADGSAPGFPLEVPGVIAVADADAIPRVRATASESSVLAAPGREILTLAPEKTYDYVSGSSISAAMVSGVIALLLERRVDLSFGETRELLERTALGSADDAFRLVNACDAVAVLVHARSCGPQK